MDTKKPNQSLSDYFSQPQPQRRTDSNSSFRSLFSTSRPPSQPTGIQAYNPRPVRVVNPPLKTLSAILNVVPQTEQSLRARIKSDSTGIINRRTITELARIIPETSKVGFDEGKWLDAAVLYIDIRNSSAITSQHTSEVAAKIYQIFHKAMVLTARHKNGQIRGYHGDRIMVVFDSGETKRSQAVETAILMQKIISEEINPLLNEAYKHPLACGIGIDFGKMLVMKVGIQGANNNDLVWAGNVANRASKLADIGTGIYVSDNVYDSMYANLKKMPFHTWKQHLSIDLKVGQYYDLQSLLLPPIV